MQRRNVITAAGTVFTTGTVAGRSRTGGSQRGGRIAGQQGGDRDPGPERDGRTAGGESHTPALLSTQSRPSPFETDVVEADETVLQFDLRLDRTAACRVAFLTRLDGDTSTFDDVESTAEADPESLVDPFRERIEATVAAAQEATGRAMTTGDYAVETDRRTTPQPTGVLTYTFRWEGFAADADPGLVAGDVIDGRTLEEGTRLTISWPEGYEIATRDPEPTDRSERNRLVTWSGPLTFEEGQPRVRVVTPSEGLPLWFSAGTVCLLGVLIVGAFSVFGREPDETDSDGGSGGTGTERKPFETVEEE